MQDISALRQRRNELSRQLESAASRRHDLAEELRSASDSRADRAGLEDRIQLLDQRILQLEADMAITGRQLTTAPSELLTTAEVSRVFGGLPPQAIVGGGFLFMILVLAPLAFAAANLMWRRATRPAPVAGDTESAARLARLETAVDTIAVEMERVSEGQRFVTRLLAESHAAPAFGANAHPGELAPIPRGVSGEARR